MNLKILQPKQGEKAYEKAASIFQNMYFSVTGVSLPICFDDDMVSDLIIIGSDAVNDFLVEKMIVGEIPNLKIRYGTDDYCIRSLNYNNRNILILAGGRGRSTVYAVYDFFERSANCHYFWDGDVIPKSDTVNITGFDVTESPRFEYRGLRYFAHRGLHRFQAEHWTFEDWKKEIDWMMKKRLNYFMLRIGMDDLWQRVYPDDIPYPSLDETSEFESFDDRSVFWSLEYRGILRKKILDYAFEYDIMHSEDCGTMSHWYSPAPKEFLESEKLKPDFLTQADEQYTNPQTLVWDIRKQSNMDKYMDLTNGYVNEFNKNAHLFHTIGMAERWMYEDKESNLRLKLFAYRKIAQSLREKYPNSKLMIASWDFVMRWKSKEVQELIKEFDPERTIILDYTSEIDDPDNSFLAWGVVKKFPWIFGLFHAYEAESSLRGPYERSDERLKVAVEDPMCKGMIFWPELSHSDPLVLEYLSQNAWSPLTMTIEEITKRYCYRRYADNKEQMNDIWQKMLPIIKFTDWGGYTNKPETDDESEKYSGLWDIHREMWTSPRSMRNIPDNNGLLHYKYQLNRFGKLYVTGAEILKDLSEISAEFWKGDFVLRDGIDIARTIIGRVMNMLVVKAKILKSESRIQEIIPIKTIFMKLLDILGKVIGSNSDFSMYETLIKLSEECYVNKNFETTIKRNAINDYCRQYITEAVIHLYPKECSLSFDEYISDTEIDYSSEFENALNDFMNTPLKDMQMNLKPDIKSVLIEASKLIGETKNIFEKD